MDSLKTKAPGILLCAIIAAIATLLSAFRAGSFSLEIVGAPVFAILMGLCCWCAIALVSLGVQLATGMFYTNL